MGRPDSVCEGAAQIHPSTRPPRRRPRHRHRCCRRRRRRRRCIAGSGRPLVNAALLPPSLPLGLPVPLTAPPPRSRLLHFLFFAVPPDVVVATGGRYSGGRLAAAWCFWDGGWWLTVHLPRLPHPALALTTCSSRSRPRPPLCPRSSCLAAAQSPVRGGVPASRDPAGGALRRIGAVSAAVGDPVGPAWYARGRDLTVGPVADAPAAVFCDFRVASPCTAARCVERRGAPVGGRRAMFYYDVTGACGVHQRVVLYGLSRERATPWRGGRGCS